MVATTHLGRQCEISIKNKKQPIKAEDSLVGIRHTNLTPSFSFYFGFECQRYFPSHYTAVKLRLLCREAQMERRQEKDYLARGEKNVHSTGSPAQKDVRLSFLFGLLEGGGMINHHVCCTSTHKKLLSLVQAQLQLHYGIMCKEHPFILAYDKFEQDHSLQQKSKFTINRCTRSIEL